MVEKPKEHPKTFTDSKGRKWTIEIGWGTMRRVKDKCGVDLNGFTLREGMADAQCKETLRRFTAFIYSPSDFPPVLMTILDSQIKAAGISEDEFMDGFETLAIIDAATNAFVQALADFTRCPHLGGAVRATMNMLTLAARKAEENSEVMLTMAEHEIDTRFKSALKNMSIVSPESPDANPKNLDPKE